MAIMGFGFASMVFGPLMAEMFDSVSIPGTFFILGAIYFILMFASASYMEPPPEGWQPENMKDAKEKDPDKEDLSQSTAFESLRTPRFYLIWIMMFINITCGIGIIYDASPFAQDSIGMTEAAAAAMVGFLGIFNGAGRIGWASFSDIIGRPWTYSTFFIIQIIAFFWLTQSPSPIMFQILVFVILTCYGGGFATLPAYLSDLFGTKELSTIHGYVLTAWAAAGLAGPTIISQIKEATKTYELTLNVFAGFFIVALIASVLLKLNIRNIKRKKLNIS